MSGLKLSRIALGLAMFSSSALVQAAPISQTQLDTLGANLDVTYRVVDNVNASGCSESLGGGKCFDANITLAIDQDLPVSGWQLYFSHTTPIQSDSSELFDIQHINGDLHTITPTAQFSGFKAGQTYSIPLKGTFWHASASDQMPNYFVVADGLKPVIIDSTREVRDLNSQLTYNQHVAPLNQPQQYLRSKEDSLPLADAQWLYNYYQDVNSQATALESNRIIPAISHVELDGGQLNLKAGIAVTSTEVIAQALAYLGKKGIPQNKQGVPVTFIDDSNLVADAYELQVSQSNISIKAGSGSGRYYALISLAALADEGQVATGRYQDSPRYPFRGMHVDVSRNFHSKEMILRLLDQMASVKLNKLHFHLADDEGWRLEIPDLPELTEIGAYRCYDPSETRCLLPQLGNGPERDTSGNGFYTVADYQEILAYAKARHIEVIPSLDMPGHSRAATRAMLARYNKYMQQEKPDLANEYLLTDLQDTTVYSSVQFYHDNTINPCLPSSYRFVTKVLNEIYKMHSDAGMPLNRYHIGADETAGAWKESPACADIIAKHNMDDPEQLTAYFVEKVTKIVNAMGVTAGAWSDGLSHVEQEKLAPRIQANIWDALFWQGHNRAQDFANRGWDVVLSIPDALYFDFPYALDPLEPGYYWASRNTDSFKVFRFMPDNLPAHAEFWPNRMGTPFTAKDDTPLKADSAFIGMQGQLWSETVRDDKRAEYMIYPRLHALAERAWHKADWEVPYQAGREYGPATDYFNADNETQLRKDWAGFSHALVNRFLPDMAGEVLFRLPPPGAKIINGKLHANSLWQGLVIEYREKGSDWQPYQNPVAVKGQLEVRSRLPGMQRSSRIIQVN
ncbi:family 20 glycosylhydrolase [Bowmanella denitrificans]|uniref:beta-N-acetylhexosaminidase n=2 Tax=Bowmanella denitrificans TaxID=366582 RepID=A0ABN0WSZ1_9ALTE